MWISNTTKAMLTYENTFSGISTTDSIVVIESGIAVDSHSPDNIHHHSPDSIQDTTFRFRKFRSPVRSDLALNQIVIITEDGKLILTPDPVKEFSAVIEEATPPTHINQRETLTLPEEEIHIEIIGERTRDVTAIKEPNIVPGGLYAVYSALLREENGIAEPSIKFENCEKCGREFLTLKHLIHHVRHLHREYPRVPEECFICGKLFAFPSQLSHHFAVIHSVSHPDFMCEVCHLRLRSSSDCEAHRFCHPATFDCIQCSESFISQYQLNMHMRGQHYEYDHKECHICGQIFETSHILQMHTLRHGRAVCGICHFSAGFQLCASKEDPEILLLKHLHSSHSIAEVNQFLEILRKQDEDELEMDTLTLTENFENSLSIRPDKLTHQSNDTQEVTVDGNKTSDLGNKKPEESEKNLRCQLCLAPATSYSALCQHRVEKHPLSRTCPICGLCFESQLCLTQHMMLHFHKNQTSKTAKGSNVSQLKDTPENTISDGGLNCSKCAKEFSVKEDLVKHVLSHQLPYKCSVCGKCFARRRLYKLHINSHGIMEDPKPTNYMCDLCPVRCGTLSGLRTHLLTHTDRKPFTCDKCGCTFRRLQGLRVHVRTVHTRSLLFQCPECGPCADGSQANSHTRASLLRHVLLVHHGVRRFVCGLCGMRWPQNQDLRRHLRFIHGREIPPIASTAKKAVQEVHVIPPLTELDPKDPLVLRLETIVEEERQKLRAATKAQNVLWRNVSQQQGEVSFTEKQSLVLLGDVASLATPLSQAKEAEPTEQQEEPAAAAVLEHVQRLQPQPQPQARQEVALLVEQQAEQAEQSEQAEQAQASDPCTADALSTLSRSLVNHVSMEHGEPAPPAPPVLLYSVLPYQPQSQPCSFFQHVDVICQSSQLTNLCSSAQPDGEGTFLRRQSSGEQSQLQSVQSGGRDSTSRCEETETECDAEQVSIFIHEESVSNAGEGPVNQPEAPSSVLCRPDPNCSSEVEILLQDHPDKREPQMTVSLSLPVVERDPQLQVPLKDAGPSAPEEVEGTRGRGVVPRQQVKSAAGSVTCEECGKQLSSAYNLDRHRLNKHAGVKQHECAQCGRKFAEKFNLTVHMRTHTGDRPYTCNICGKKMRYFNELKEHRDVHEGKRNLQCSLCGQTFRRRRDLNRHSLIHVDDANRLKCTVCNKAFARTDSLKAHLKTHAADKASNKLRCTGTATACEASFGDKDSLRRHQEHQHGDGDGQSLNKVSCELCSKEFSKKCHLRAHLRTEHAQDSRQRLVPRKNGVLVRGGPKGTPASGCASSELEQGSGRDGRDENQLLITAALTAATHGSLGSQGVEFVFVNDTSTPLAARVCGINE